MGAAIGFDGLAKRRRAAGTGLEPPTAAVRRSRQLSCAWLRPRCAAVHLGHWVVKASACVERSNGATNRAINRPEGNMRGT